MGDAVRSFKGLVGRLCTTNNKLFSNWILCVEKGRLREDYGFFLLLLPSFLLCSSRGRDGVEGNPRLNDGSWDRTLRG